MKIDLLSNLNLKRVDFNSRFSSNPIFFKGESDSVQMSEVAKAKSRALAEYQKICAAKEKEFKRNDIKVEEIEKKIELLKTLLEAMSKNEDFVSEHQKMYEESVEQYKSILQFAQDADKMTNMLRYQRELPKGAVSEFLKKYYPDLDMKFEKRKDLINFIEKTSKGCMDNYRAKVKAQTEAAVDRFLSNLDKLGLADKKEEIISIIDKKRIANDINFNIEDFIKENIYCLSKDKEGLKNSRYSIENSINLAKEKLDEYFYKLDHEPFLIAQMYYPYGNTWKEACDKAVEAGVCARWENLANQDSDYAFRTLDFYHELRKMRLIKMHRVHHGYLLDLTDESTREVVEKIKSGVLKTESSIKQKYKFPSKYLYGLPIKTVSLSSMNPEYRKNYMFIDVSDEKTVEQLEATAKLWERTQSKPSKYFLEKERKTQGGTDPDKLSRDEAFYAPVEYLLKLGFGPKESILRVLKNRMVKAKKVQEGDKTNIYINIYDTCSSSTLKELREVNSNVMKVLDFARACQMKKEAVLDAIMDGELDIIDEYIYPSSTEYISLDNEKNKAFLEKKQFEAEVRANIKREQIQAAKEAAKAARAERADALTRKQSLRMKLVWYFCPNTKKIASDLAQRDGYLCSLLAKQDNDEEELTRKEEIKVRSYEKEVWLRAGVEELKEAHKKADEILNLYFSEGIKAIEDPEIREIIRLYYN